ncbi:PfkB family carbohydrate kinase [Streptomyces sp. NBC_01235]|uniref:PfkB family carbohydrate kinase n=1 Tax=Streptomyces sp. NBC_01235 TaxID=2903788 RepID=UPI002E11B2A1|nr:PfkB family carbohydrate kinase [Streptomyces sp. NBC_01235]
MAESVQPLDLITMGRIGVDLYPPRTGVPLARAETFEKFFGDGVTDVAVAATRLGRTAAVLTRADDLDFFALRAARVLWINGTALGAEPARSATLAALKVRDRAAITVFDLDLRPASRPDPGDGRPYYAEALRHATVAVGDLDACEIATGVREPRACAEELLAAGVELAVVRQGRAGGVLAVHRDGTSAEAAARPVEAVNGVGAAGAFGGCLVHGLLSGWELRRIVRYAEAAGSLVATRPEHDCAMPTQAEVEELLAHH